MSVEWFILLYDTQTKKFRPMRLLIARWAPTRNLHSILRSPTSATSGSLSFYPKEQLSSFFTPTTYAKIWRIRKAHAHGQIERNYRVYKSDRRKFRRRLLSIPYGGPMRCTSRGPHQLQALSLRPVGSQGVSRSAYGNRSRENSGWLGDGACVCALADTKTSLKSYNLIGRRIISIISPSRISRIPRICPTKRDL